MLRPLSLGTALLLSPVALAAQTIPLPLDNSSIAPQAPEPTPTPSPVATPTPVPTATPTPAPPRAAPSPRPEPRPTPSPSATPTPLPAASPAPAPTPTTVPSAAASPAPAIETVVLPHQPARAAPLWPWFAGGAAVLLALAALLLRRRGARVEAEAEDAFPEPEPAPPIPPAPAAARLILELRPTRAGVNLLTATLDAEVTVTNSGDTPATDIRAVVALSGAGGSETATIEALAAQPIGKPDTPPFTLAPGEARRFRTVAALPLDAIQPLTVADRPLFVPLAVATVQWHDGDATRRTTQGFAVGVERVDSAKLAPLWLDLPPRSYDAVAARPHGAAIETRPAGAP